MQPVRTICVVNQREVRQNIGHSILYLPFLWHFRGVCNVIAYAFERPPDPDVLRTDWTFALWHALFPSIVDLATLNTSEAFRYVLAPVQPMAFDYNFVYPPGSVDGLRDRVFAAHGIAPGPGPAPGRLPVALIATRHSVRGRAVQNATALEAQVAAAGFEVRPTDLGSLPFAAQAAAVAAADVLVAPHGAALTNAYALPARGCVVELFPDGFVGTHYAVIVLSARRCYAPVVNAAPGDGGRPRWDCVACQRGARGADIVPEPDALTLALNFCAVCSAHAAAGKPAPVTEADRQHVDGAGAGPGGPVVDQCTASDARAVAFLDPAGGAAFANADALAQDLQRHLGLEALRYRAPVGDADVARTYVLVSPYAAWLELAARLPRRACVVEVFTPAQSNATRTMAAAMEHGLCYSPFVAPGPGPPLHVPDWKLLLALSVCEYCTRQLRYPKISGHLSYYEPWHVRIPQKYREALG